MRFFPKILPLCLLAAGSCLAAEPAPCKYLITAADDFIVDVYQNGERVPDAKRELLAEIFGATTEKINVAVKPGDWLVFHVVQDRMRWNGANYFAVAGCFAKDEFAFVSDPASEAWSACDEPSQADAFIRGRDVGRRSRARAIENPWGDGDGIMHDRAGASFSGKPLWGSAPSTWIKYTAPAAAPEPKIIATTPPASAPKRWPVQILSAIYGTGGKDADVTARVKELVEKSPRIFSANPGELGADPNPGWNKGLHIIYMKDGVRREQHRNENETILPESFYGPQDPEELKAWLAESRWSYGAGAEVQLHANGTFTFVGNAGAHPWTVTAANRLRLSWPGANPTEYGFDYKLTSFSEPGHDENVFQVVK